mmetsp:Transcript_35032/g.100872  ORF Transcript_35032/g.100872 Transcript_35032/m.100872 type:complete len:354 (+) Transcript_35032:232-1293(+)
MCWGLQDRGRNRMGHKVGGQRPRGTWAGNGMGVPLRERRAAVPCSCWHRLRYPCARARRAAVMKRGDLRADRGQLLLQGGLDIVKAAMLLLSNPLHDLLVLGEGQGDLAVKRLQPLDELALAALLDSLPPKHPLRCLPLLLDALRDLLVEGVEAPEHGGEVLLVGPLLLEALLPAEGQSVDGEAHLLQLALAPTNVPMHLLHRHWPHALGLEQDCPGELGTADSAAVVCVHKLDRALEFPLREVHLDARQQGHEPWQCVADLVEGGLAAIINAKAIKEPAALRHQALAHEFLFGPGLLPPQLVLLEHALADDAGQQGDHAEAANDDKADKEHREERLVLQELAFIHVHRHIRR